jgi:threonine-phosphate decarboxylase
MLKGHGGNIYAIARQFGWEPSEIIDMSSNINPLGPPPGLLDFLKENLMSLTDLPEVDSEEAIKYFAEYMHIGPERVIAGNGTTQFIYALPSVLKSKSALILGPTYSDYADACAMHRIKCSSILAEESEDFRPNIEYIKKHLIGKDTVFICNPNNPTGCHIPFEKLRRLCKAYSKTNFIIDESYLPFVIGAEKESMANAELENVIVLASLSKIFRIPGLRIGFTISSPITIEKLKKYLLPWSVNSLAQAAVRYLDVQKTHVDVFVQNSRTFFENQRQYFYQRLRHIPNIKAYPSCTPFVLVKLPSPMTANEIWAQLTKDKILIRNCSNFYGLSDRYIRISLKIPEANQMVADKLSILTQSTKDDDHSREEKRVA